MSKSKLDANNLGYKACGQISYYVSLEPALLPSSSKILVLHSLSEHFLKTEQPLVPSSPRVARLFKISTALQFLNCFYKKKKKKTFDVKTG